MEESKRGNHNRFENLAPEIISDILSRLPIEWILNCKSVCKTWYTLIKDNYFVKLQLSIANDRPSSRVIFEPHVHCIRHGVTKLYLLDVEDCNAREIPGYPLADTNHYGTNVSIMCSLDGLICLSSRWHPNPVLIYNPLIRGDYIILPETEVGNISRSHHVTLGFDPSINKYKAVRMLSYSDDSYRIRSLCEVITIGGKASWRRVVVPYAGLTHQLFRGGVFHRGSIYWIISKFNIYNGETTNSNNREYILEFDVTNEVFGVISFPNSVRAPNRLPYMMSNMQLQILEGGSVALMQNDGQLLHIWRITKQNGNPIVGYSSIRIESAYKGAKVIRLLCPNSTEDFLFLQTLGGYEPGRRRKGEGRNRKEPQFLYYYPFSSSSKKSDRFVKLSSLQILSQNFIPRCFKPSLVSAKSALLRN